MSASPARHDESPIRSALLWAALLVPPLAWTVQLSAAYLLVSIACQRDVPVVNLWLALVALAALLLDAGAGVVAFLGWRATGVAMDSERAGVTGRDAMLGVVALAMSGVFAFAIVLTGLSWAIIPTCA